MLNCFNHSDTMTWKQPSNIKVNDIIYLYVGAPIRAILYKCKVNKINIPYSYKDENLTINKVMEIQLLSKYEKNKYTLAFLNKEGVKSIRGPRYLPNNISKLINN